MPGAAVGETVRATDPSPEISLGNTLRYENLGRIVSVGEGPN